jgi:hypothetical protein
VNITTFVVINLSTSFTFEFIDFLCYVLSKLRENYNENLESMKFLAKFIKLKLIKEAFFYLDKVKNLTILILNLQKTSAN